MINHTIKDGVGGQKEIQAPQKSHCQLVLDNVRASIRMLALEIEEQPVREKKPLVENLQERQQRPEEKVVQQAISNANNNACVQRVAQPPNITEEEKAQEEMKDSQRGQRGSCFLKTRSGGFKQYTIAIEDGDIKLSREGCTKSTEIEYAVSQVQCLINLQSQAVGQEKKQSLSQRESCTGQHCLILSFSVNHKRAVYFETEAELKLWHKRVLTAQGYFPDLINQYQALKTLGEGAFGVVVLSSHRNSGLKVAIKIVQKKKIEEVYYANNHVFAEQQNLLEVTRDNCSNLLHVVEAFEDEQAYYIVTCYMPGGDLFQHIRNFADIPLSESEAAKILKQVGTGVKALHQRNIIHRDIKIENILCKENSSSTQFILGDLGSSEKLSSPDAKATFKIGTPGYVAPEILKGVPYGTSCDIWSLGALMHILLAERIPFYHKDRAERKRLVCTEPLDLEAYEDTACLSDPAKELLERMLCKEPSERPSIDEVLSHPWFDLN